MCSKLEVIGEPKLHTLSAHVPCKDLIVSHGAWNIFKVTLQSALIGVVIVKFHNSNLVFLNVHHYDIQTDDMRCFGGFKRTEKELLIKVINS